MPSIHSLTLRACLVMACATLCVTPVTPLSAQAAVKIVALGASNTQGHGVSRAQAYPARLQALLKARGINATVVNAGIFGDTTGGMLARLERAVPAGTQVVILQPGGNDARQGKGAERSANIATIKSRLAARDIKLVMMENSMLAEVPRSELQSDGIHFTAKGYAILAQNILPSVLGRTAISRHRRPDRRREAVAIIMSRTWAAYGTKCPFTALQRVRPLLGGVLPCS
jgi:acyl-CoA thioesterase I